MRVWVSEYITKVAFDAGARVKEGDLLFEIDPKYQDDGDLRRGRPRRDPAPDRTRAERGRLPPSKGASRRGSRPARDDMVTGRQGRDGRSAAGIARAQPDQRGAARPPAHPSHRADGGRVTVSRARSPPATSWGGRDEPTLDHHRAGDDRLRRGALSTREPTCWRCAARLESPPHSASLEPGRWPAGVPGAAGELSLDG